MLEIDANLEPADLAPGLAALWPLAADKIAALDAAWQHGSGAPVFTIQGRYQAQGWTEWTQGFQYGAPLLVFDASGNKGMLEIGRRRTLDEMAPHVTHTGVHDHGFNCVSTYGNLWRLIGEGRIPRDVRELQLYELALKCSGAVQAARWTATADGGGFVYSFNGPHSLFCDTIRSLRALALAHRLGHILQGENDVRIDLLERLVEHARATARYSVYYGEERDTYDVRGRVAHESVFNISDGNYRCPSTQQGYSPFSTWTRGLAWIVLGFAELLEFCETLDDGDVEPLGGRAEIEATMLRAAEAACDFYIEQTPTDGIPYWDTGAPGLAHLGDYLGRPADPLNDFEPVDSSAAAIACQGLLRLGRYLRRRDDLRRHKGAADGNRYWQAGLGVLRRLLEEPYLATDPAHQGLLLHTVYHRPRGWDYVPAGADAPRGEACMWGDYHLLEAALCVQRVIDGGAWYTFSGSGETP